MASHLQTQGVRINDRGISVQPNVVVLELDHTTVKIPMKLFRIFAEWYLEEQDVEVEVPNVSNNTSSKSGNWINTVSPAY